MDRSINTDRHRQAAELLKKTRVRAGLSQVQVAGRLGRHHPYVHNFETGWRRLELVRLKLFAHALGTTVAAIVTALDHPGDLDAGDSSSSSRATPAAVEDRAPAPSDAACESGWRRLCERLRELRNAAGLTESGLAHALGTTQSFVAKYETGARRLDLIELEQIAAALGTTLLALVAEFETAVDSAVARSTAPSPDRPATPDTESPADDTDGPSAGST